MAIAPTVPFIPVEEYLNTSYYPDCEYVDGILVERSLPTYVHGLLQSLIIMVLAGLRKHPEISVVTEVRVEIVPGARYRVPDVLITREPAERALQTPPIVVIEILSPDDRTAHQIARFREFWERGTRQIVLLDPVAFRAFRYEDGALKETVIDSFDLGFGESVAFSSTELLDELKAKLKSQLDRLNSRLPD